MELTERDIKKKMKHNILIKVNNQVVGNVPVLNIIESYDTKNNTECTTSIKFNKQRVAEAFSKALL